jgi:GAF domain-containing protein
VRTRQHSSRAPAAKPVVKAAPRTRGQGSKQPLARALVEAHEQQAATSEILRVISRSPGDAKPVFEAIVSSAARLCEAQFAYVALHVDGVLAAAAHTPCSSEFADYLVRGWLVNTETTAGRAVLTRQAVQVLDFMSEAGIRATSAHHSEHVRTVLVVPMLRGERVLGVIGVWRREVRAFSERQIALLQTFAEQTLIALDSTVLIQGETGKELVARAIH